MARSPLRQVAVVKNPLDGEDLAACLAGKLGVHSADMRARGHAWRVLERGIRLCAVQGLSVVLAVDDCRLLRSTEGRHALIRLVQLGGSLWGNVTVLLSDEAEGAVRADLLLWALAARLRALSVSEVETYLSTKLAAAGCREPIFSTRAATRLQLLSAGTPRGVERLASLSLIAGASRGLEAVTVELVESVVAECHTPEELAYGV
jgi:hypothetical protein